MGEFGAGGLGRPYLHGNGDRLVVATTPVEELDDPDDEAEPAEPGYFAGELLASQPSEARPGLRAADDLGKATGLDAGQLSGLHQALREQGPVAGRLAVLARDAEVLDDLLAGER